MTIHWDRPETLFSHREMRQVLAENNDEMLREIAAYPDNELLNIGMERLLEYFVQKYTLELPAIHEDKQRLRQSEIKVDVRNDPNRVILDRSRPAEIDGTRYEFVIPISGEREYFESNPSSIPLQYAAPVVAKLEDNTIVYTYNRVNTNASTLKAEHEGNMRVLRQRIQAAVDDVSGYNAGIRQSARNAIQARRDRLLADQGIAAELGIPLERADVPKTYAAPEVRRKITISRPLTSSKPYKPEPALEMEEYEHILEIMRSMTTVIERNAPTFVGSTEPQLRDHFLVQLNGHYNGQATGETFNAAGKTDILIRSDGKNIFIAECKFWDGPQTLLDALKQLLSYATWRDSKLALVILNRTRNFTGMLEKVPATLEKHDNVIKRLGFNSDTDFRFLLRHTDDPDKELYLTVMCFDVPAGK